MQSHHNKTKAEIQLDTKVDQDITQKSTISNLNKFNSPKTSINGAEKVGSLMMLTGTNNQEMASYTRTTSDEGQDKEFGTSDRDKKTLLLDPSSYITTSDQSYETSDFEGTNQNRNKKGRRCCKKNKNQNISITKGSKYGDNDVTIHFGCC